MKKIPSNRSRLLIAASEQDADLYYATGFLAPDPFILLQIKGRKHLLMSDLEVDRARLQARGCKIHALSALQSNFEKKHSRKGSFLELLADYLKKKRIRRLGVPSRFPVGYADFLRRKGLKIIPEADPFCDHRSIKTPKEIAAIRRGLRGVERAVSQAVAVLRRSKIRNGFLYEGGKILTSERLRQVIHAELFTRNMSANRTIVACGRQTVDPHQEGSGPLRTHRPIIIDVFPRDNASRYFSDFTRTFVRGKASARIKKMYAAVREAQQIAFCSLRAGTDASRIHRKILAFFESRGFTTGARHGRMQGFFHGTGHGLGLEIHEPPSIGLLPQILESGNVVTVEPGLYYYPEGGVRLEDVVVITSRGCRNLTRFPKFLEI